MTHTIERREGHFLAHDGAELFYQSWHPKSPSKGVLVITHGLSEHSECYHPTAEHLNRSGWTVFAWDLRGHGRSEGQRGVVRDFVEFSRDLAQFLDFLTQKKRLNKFALVGHSMGGLITLRHLLSEELRPAPAPFAVCLSAPALGIAVAVPKLKELAARLLFNVWPTLALYNEVNYSALSRDPTFLKSYETDALRHDKISPSLYHGMLDAMVYVGDRLGRLSLPTLIQVGTADPVVSVTAIREAFPRIGSVHKELHVYEGSLHEIFNDLDREKVFKDLDTFLSPFLTE